MVETKRAHFVCHACHVRKKACDKALPACSFCTRRNLSCRYDITAQSKKAYRPYNPGKYFVAIDALAPRDDLPAFKSHPSVVRAREPQDSIHKRVLDLMSCSDLTADGVAECYFRSFHDYCPVIAPELFSQRAAKYQRLGGDPPADFSILLLAMYFTIMIPGPDRPSYLSCSGLEQLYVNTKSLFAQSEATICTSKYLLQALLLIATGEYLCMRPQAAYVSMSTCSGLARVLGFGKGSLDASESIIEVERANIMWAIAITERIVVAELGQKSLMPLTEYPDPASPIPSDLRLDQRIGYKASSPLSCLNDSPISFFGRQAQAVWLLDQIMCMPRATCSNMHDMLHNLAELDGKIREFMAILMEESRRMSQPLCTPVALSLRSLLLLHGTALDALSNPCTDEEYQARRFSQAALRSACKMVVEAIRLAGRGLKKAPICCFYNLQVAMRYMSEDNYYDTDEAMSADYDCLLHAYTAFRSMVVSS